MNFDPGNWFFFIIVSRQIFDVGTSGLHNFVAVKTNIHGRNSCVPACFNRNMAIHTGDIIFTSMKFMAERQGLHRGVTLIFCGSNRKYDPHGDKK